MHKSILNKAKLDDDRECIFKRNTTSLGSVLKGYVWIFKKQFFENTVLIYWPVLRSIFDIFFPWQCSKVRNFLRFLIFSVFYDMTDNKVLLTREVGWWRHFTFFLDFNILSRTLFVVPKQLEIIDIPFVRLVSEKIDKCAKCDSL